MLKKIDSFRKIMNENKIFAIKFVVKEGKMGTKMTSKNIAPQEMIGLLEIAKQQILDSLKENKKEIFHGSQNE